MCAASQSENNMEERLDGIVDLVITVVESFRTEFGMHAMASLGVHVKVVQAC